MSNERKVFKVELTKSEAYALTTACTYMGIKRKGSNWYEDEDSALTSAYDKLGAAIYANDGDKIVVKHIGEEPDKNENTDS